MRERRYQAVIKTIARKGCATEGMILIATNTRNEFYHTSYLKIRKGVTMTPFRPSELF
jgi:hypothetical protein